VSSFDRVIREPGSLSARYALLDEWRSLQDVRAAFLAEGLEAFELKRRKDPRAHDVNYALQARIRRFGPKTRRRLAGRVLDLVDGVGFGRGLVDEATVECSRFLGVCDELFASAPIQHLRLTGARANLRAILDARHMDQLGSLSFERGSLSDADVQSISESPRLRNLKWLMVSDQGITRPGVDAIAKSPYLRDVRYIDFSGNPSEPKLETASFERGLEAVYYERANDEFQHFLSKYPDLPWLRIPAEGEPYPPDIEPLIVTP